MLSLEEPSFEKALASGRMLFVRSKPFTPHLQAGQQLRSRLLANPRGLPIGEIRRECVPRTACAPDVLRLSGLLRATTTVGV